MTTRAIYFSPTGTTEKIIHCVVDGCGLDSSVCINLTAASSRKSSLDLSDVDRLIIGFPVYADRLPELFEEQLKRAVYKSGAVAVLIAVYGNRAAGSSCCEAFEILSENGVGVARAAEFIGEHSFSSKEFPIACGRPDADDLKVAEEFGMSLKDMFLNSSEIKIFHRSDELWQGEEYRDRTSLGVHPPLADENCIKCGECSAVCPVGILNSDGTYNMSGECLACCACVKVCRFNAKTAPDKITSIAERLHRNCSEYKHPKIISP